MHKAAIIRRESVLKFKFTTCSAEFFLAPGKPVNITSFRMYTIHGNMHMQIIRVRMNGSHVLMF